MLTKTGTFLYLVGTRNFLIAIYELWTKDIQYLYECKEGLNYEWWRPFKIQMLGQVFKL